jgi:hypothetical protein
MFCVSSNGRIRPLSYCEIVLETHMKGGDDDLVEKVFRNLIMKGGYYDFSKC